ncbi:hypothetical protein KI387_009850, partial [Taxus chinensis]
MARAGSKRKLSLLNSAQQDGCRRSSRLRKTDNTYKHVTNLENCKNTSLREIHNPGEKIKIIVDISDSDGEANTSNMNARENTDAVSTAEMISPAYKSGVDSSLSFAKQGFSTPNLLRNDKETSSLSSCQTNITGDDFEVVSFHKLASEVESLEKGGGELSRDRAGEEKNQMHALEEKNHILEQFHGESEPSEQNNIYNSPAASFQNMTKDYHFNEVNQVEEMEDTGQYEKEVKSFSHFLKQKENGRVGQNYNTAEIDSDQLPCTVVSLESGRGRPKKLESNDLLEGTCNITGGFEMGNTGQNKKEVENKFSYSSSYSQKGKENGSKVGQNCIIAEIDFNQTACTETPMSSGRGRPLKLENNVHSEGTCKQDTSAIYKPSKENIRLSHVPTSSVKLLSTGLLEGYSVQYLYRNETLWGTIVGEGILCQCRKCKGEQVVNLTIFEKHAGSAAKRPSDYIRFENKTSFSQLVRAVSNTPLDKIPDVIKASLEIVSSKMIDSSGQSGDYVNFSSQPRLHQTSSRCNLDPSAHTMIHEQVIVKEKKSDGECNYVKKRKRGRPPFIMSRIMSDRPKRRRPSKNILPLEARARYISEPVNIPSASKKSKETSLHKLIFMPGSGIPDGTLLSYYMKGQHFLDGHKQDSGILCSCCNEVVSCSLFEVHAGWGTRKSPYNHIYLSDGRTLHEVALSIANETRVSEKEDPNYNEDFCAVCGDVGHLLCCDGCTKSFHKECLGICHEPVSRYWFCPSHQGCSLTGGKTSKNYSFKISRKFGFRALKGRLPKRLTRVINKAEDNSNGGCVLCRHGGFTKYGFDERTILFCDQCEKEFHVGCLRDHGITDLKELPKGNWFCSNDCSEIHDGLQKHVANGPQCLGSYISESIRLKVQNNVDQGWQDEIKLQILHGKTKDLDSKDLLSEAEAIYHDRFESIVDPSTGRDLIPLMLYSKSMRDQDFGGMYTAVLTLNSEVVSAAVFRVFGRQIAELPLVATRVNNQGQGYFQSLFLCIEEIFCSLNIKHIVLPAAEEAEPFWLEKFGFKKIPREQ